MNEERYAFDKKAKSFIDTKKDMCLNFGVKDLARVEVELNTLDLELERKGQRIKELKEDRMCYEGLVDYYDNEIKTLTKQLHELPKKICDEIRQSLTGKVLSIDDFNRILNQIQAKYEKGEYVR